MSENPVTADSEFPDLIGDRKTVLPDVEDVEKLAVFPQENVIFPIEKMTLEITDERAQKLFQTAFEQEEFVGILYQPKGESGLPEPGTLGVAAFVREITKTGFGSLQLVQIRGYIRFQLDEYVETDQPYPVAKVTFFEDEDDEWQEKQILRQLEELRGHLREWLKHGRGGQKPKKHAQMLPETVTYYESETYSFFFWRWARITPDVRHYLLSLRSTYERLICLNMQFRKGLDEINPEQNSRFN